MTLIHCPECNTEVSNNAELCPKCGNPIAQKNNNQTIQKRKPLKLHLIIAIGIFIIGGVIIYSSLNSNFTIYSFPGYSVFGIILMLAVIIWLSIVTFLNWWKRK
jgi:hypothetical protein